MNEDMIGDVRRRHLVASLAGAARTQARLAMEAHGDQLDPGSGLRAAIAAGVAVELALKAALAATLPSLLAEKGDIHSQLYLMGLGGLPTKSQSDVRTLGGYEAARAFVALKPQVKLSLDDARSVLDARNGASHLAEVIRPELDKAIRAMAACLTLLLPEVGMTPHDFWGSEFEDQASALVKEGMDLREVRVEQARSAALVRLARLKALGPDAFSAMVETLGSEGLEPQENGDQYREPYECPVCEHYGWLSGIVERGELQSDGEQGTWVERLFVPTDFECDVCRFVVSDGDLSAVGLPESMELQPDESPWELREMYEDVLADEAFERMREDRWDRR